MTASRVPDRVQRCLESMDIRLDGVELTLLPKRAIWWKARATVFIADAHFGKAAAFRQAGVPIPESLEADLARLDALLAATTPGRLVILGDLRHTRGDWPAHLVELLVAWRSKHATLEIVLVRGNHDRYAGDPPAELRIHCVDEPWHDGELTLCHDACEGVAGPALCGHVHPGLLLPDGRRSLRVPAFVRRANFLFLPSFGSFTGSAAVDPRDVDGAWAIVGEAMLCVKGNRANHHRR